MNQIELGEVIVKRELYYDSPDETGSLMIKLGKPRPDSKQGGDWECPIQIGKTIKLVFGVDSFQALSLALRLISIELQYLENKQKIELNWLGMDDLGFKTIRDNNHL